MDDTPIGGISINFGKMRRIAEMGYCISKPHWGQGLASDATAAVVTVPFESYAASG